jgi:hypothetical protein
VRRWNRWTIAFAGWTLFVWLGRVRNAGADIGPLLMATTFIVLAVAVLVTRRREVLAALSLWTAGVWIVRGSLIWVHDHEVGFKVVHTVLAVISIGLAALAWRSAQRDVEREREAATSSARLQELADR